MHNTAAALCQRILRLCRWGVCWASLSAFACPPAWGQPSVPWTPSAAGRHAIELLVDEAGLDLITSQWPLPLDAVSRALDALPPKLPAALDDARWSLRRELLAQRGSQLSLTVRGRADGLPGFGDDSTPGSSVALRSSVLDSPYLTLQLGGRIESRANADRSGSQFRLDDSAVVTEALGIQLQAWAHRSWWGPGWQSALALSNNAPPFTGIGLQRASASTSESPWLAWLGPWNFDLFVAQAEGVSQPANPFFIGNRLTLRPFSNLEIGFTRTVQWGGRGRHPSLGSLFRLLSGSHTNPGSAAEQAQDPGNQLGGFDLRLRCPSGLRCAGYAQLIGEDEADYLPSKFLGMYGVEVWSEDGGDRFFAEYAETGCRSPVHREPEKGCAYRNYAYPEGYVNAGRWIGSSAGPDSRLLTLGWIGASTGRSVKLNLGRVGSRIGSYSPLPDDPRSSGRLIGIAASHSFQWGAATVAPQLELTRVEAPEGARTEVRLGAHVRMSLDSAFEGTRAGLGESLAGREGTPWAQALVGAGLVAGSALFDHTLDDYARNHGSNPSARALRRVGNALPFAAFGMAGLSWLSQPGSPHGDVGFSAASAGVGAVLASELVKVAVSRSRPTSGLGASSFGQASHAQRAFPSGHSALAWAVITPYALHYDAPWLYGVAALTNAARVMGRDHWLSDTVGGAVLGYWIGQHIYRQSDAAAKGATGPRLSLSPRSVVLQIPFD